MKKTIQIVVISALLIANKEYAWEWPTWSSFRRQPSYYKPSAGLFQIHKSCV